MKSNRKKEYLDCINKPTAYTDEQINIVCEDIMDIEQLSDKINKVERGFIQ